MTSNVLTLDAFETPFPKIGEFLRAIASVLESKPTDKALDRIAREGDFDYKLVEHYTKEVLTLPFGKNRGKCESVISKLQFSIVKQYVEFIKTHSQPGLSRNDVMPALVNIAGLTLKEKAAEILSEHEYLLNEFLKSKEPIRVAFEWLGALHKESWIKFRSSLPKSEVDKTLRWIKGEQPPQITGLFSILQQFFEHANLSAVQRDLCNEVFFVAKIFQNSIQIASPFTLFDSESTVDLRIRDFLELENTEKDDYQDLLSECEQLILGNFIRKTRDAHQIDKLLKELEGFCLEKNAPQCFQLNVMRLRSLFYVFSGDFENAISIYKEIAPIALYAGENYSSDLFCEALVLSAYRGDRPFFKRLKHQGIVFGLFGKPIESEYSQANKLSRSKDQTAEDWEVLNWAGRLYEVFPIQLFFCSTSELPEIKTNSGFICFTNEELNIIPNMSNANDILNISGKRYPQIVWFAQIGDYASVEKLLKARANVDAMTSSGESALFFSIQAMNPTVLSVYSGCNADSDLFKLVSEYPHEKKTINTPTNAKKWTCLGCAVETGRPHVVSTVLKMGAVVDHNHSVDCITPLYLAVQNYSKDNIDFEKLLTQDSFSDEQLDGMRRGVDLFRNRTNSEIKQLIIKMRQDPVYSKINKKSMVFMKDAYKSYDHASILQIIQILLESGANPNQPHSINNIIGYTPLMLSAEKNSLPVFKMLIEHGGNPNKTCKTFDFDKPVVVSCWEIAVKWGSSSIIKYLEANKDRFKP